MKEYLKLVLLVAALLGCTSFVRGEDTAEETLQGIVANLQDNFAACTEENMDRLLDCMSEEMPNRRLFISTVRRTWDVEDAYHRLDDVKLLKRSHAPHARTDFPYATAVVTQTVLSMSSRQERLSVFRSACENGRCKSAADMEHLMAISPNHKTVRLQMLFKKEDGRWKLIAGLTRPEPVDPEAEAPAEDESADVGVPQSRTWRQPAGGKSAGRRSVFN